MMLAEMLFCMVREPTVFIIPTASAEAQRALGQAHGWLHDGWRRCPPNARAETRRAREAYSALAWESEESALAGMACKRQADLTAGRRGVGRQGGASRWSNVGGRTLAVRTGALC